MYFGYILHGTKQSEDNVGQFFDDASDSRMWGDPLVVRGTLEHEFTVIEKQVKKLLELADAPAVAYRKERSERVGEIEAEFLLVHRQQMRQLLEGLKLRVESVRYMLQKHFAALDAATLDEGEGGASDADKA